MNQVSTSLSSRLLERITQPADGRDHIRSELLPDARDENLDRVGIAVEILVVNMLDQLGTGNDLALVMHQIGEQFIFLGGELHRLPIEGHLARARVETDVAGGELGTGIARRAANERAKT